MKRATDCKGLLQLVLDSACTHVIYSPTAASGPCLNRSLALCMCECCVLAEEQADAQETILALLLSMHLSWNLSHPKAASTLNLRRLVCSLQKQPSSWTRQST